MRWLRLVGSLKTQVSFAKEPYKRNYILHKRPVFLRSLLIIATPYAHRTPFHPVSFPIHMCDTTLVSTHGQKIQVTFAEYSLFYRVSTHCHTEWRRLIGSLILQVIFRKSDLYLVALLWKMIGNLWDPMSLRHPVLMFICLTSLKHICNKKYRSLLPNIVSFIGLFCQIQSLFIGFPLIAILMFICLTSLKHICNNLKRRRDVCTSHTISSSFTMHSYA